EADEILGLVRDMAHEGLISALIITHKFREVREFADEVTVLRRGRFAGAGRVEELSADDMAKRMVGEGRIDAPAERLSRAPGRIMLTWDGLSADDDEGTPAVRDVTVEVRAGEIVGIAGVSGNGQSELVEVLAGQRTATGGAMQIDGEIYTARRAE